MRVSLLCVIGLLAVLSAVTAQATTLTFYGQTVNNKSVPTEYGSDVSVDTMEFVASDGTGTTPNIALAWPAHEVVAGGIDGEGSVFEFHNGAGFAANNEEPILQLQMEGRVNMPTITFTPDPGYGVKIISFDLGSANNSGPTTPYAWTVTISEAAAPETPLLTKQTLPHGRTALDVETVALNFTGEIGKAYVLRLDDGGIESYNGAFDNLKFSQLVPEPSTIAFLLIGLIGLASSRRRR